LSRVLPVEEIEQFPASLDSPLADLTPERKNCDLFGGIFQEGFRNENFPLGVQFVNPIYDIFGPNWSATAKESYEDQEGQNSEKSDTGCGEDHVIEYITT
jgi:hypothetical protein